MPSLADEPSVSSRSCGVAFLRFRRPDIIPLPFLKSEDEGVGEVDQHNEGLAWKRRKTRMTWPGRGREAADHFRSAHCCPVQSIPSETQFQVHGSGTRVEKACCMVQTRMVPSPQIAVAQ